MCFGGNDTQTVKSSTDPWKPQQPYLQQILGQAQELYNRGGTPVVGFSPQTEQALRMTENRALAGSPLQTAANTQLQNTINGNFLSTGNPYFQQAFNAAARPITENFMQSVAPGIDGGFSRAGRLGSGAYAQARNRAEDTLARNLTELGGTMGYQMYGDERARQQQAIGMAPQLAAGDYADAQALAGVGGAREGLAQQQANQPLQSLQDYLALVGGNYGSTSTQTSPLYQNRASGALGGALAGLQVAGQFPGLGIGAPWAAGIGGLLGML